MKITIFGSGYVGLVTGACLSAAGHEVMCMDVNESRIVDLNNGIVPIYEPGLEELISSCVQHGTLHFVSDAAVAVAFSDLIFIAVGTPPDEDGSADLQYVISVASMIGDLMVCPKVIVDKSTVPVGTADKVVNAIQEALDTRSLCLDFEVCSNPEFLKEGSAISDFSKGARYVIGTQSEMVKQLMTQCYSAFNREKDRMVFMDVKSAELTKYAANAMLATKISFMNEMANIAELLGADIEHVRKGIGSDPRIGYQFIYPGCGYGGSCFPKDVQALKRSAAEVGYDAQLITAVDDVNYRQKDTLYNKLKIALPGSLSGRTIAVWGLSFKPNTDDMRESPSRKLMESIWQDGGHVKAFDPQAAGEARRIYGDRTDLILVTDKLDALIDSDALVICTEWLEFRGSDLPLKKRKLKSPIVIDGRNIFDPTDAKNAGLKYFGVGRGLSVRGDS